MLARVGLRHQHLDVASDKLFRGIAEQPLGRVVNRADRTVPVDDHDGVDRGVDDRAIKGVGETPAISRCRLDAVELSCGTLSFASPE